MLGLKFQTDTPRVNILENDIHGIFTNDAYCLQKAAISTISLIVKFHELKDQSNKWENLLQFEAD